MAHVLIRWRDGPAPANYTSTCAKVASAVIDAAGYGRGYACMAPVPLGKRMVSGPDGVLSGCFDAVLHFPRDDLEEGADDEVHTTDYFVHR